VPVAREAGGSGEAGEPGTDDEDIVIDHCRLPSGITKNST
jgi:hypothetical protein